MEKIKKLLHRDSIDDKVDLHFHSYYSDGELSPRLLIERFWAEGKTLVSLTDHDGIKGSEEAREEAENKGMTYIDGIEISAHHLFDEKLIGVHILGYGIDITNPELLEVLERLESFRKNRNILLLEALNKAGYDIEEDDMVFRKGQTFIGKTLIARALINKGYLKTKAEAFQEGGVFENPIIRKVKKEKVSAKEAVDLIHKCGGIAVIAHPGRLRHIGKMESEEFYSNAERFIDELQGLGVDGIEAWYKHFSKAEQERFAQMGRKKGLILTGGSDFHGEELEPED